MNFKKRLQPKAYAAIAIVLAISLFSIKIATTKAEQSGDTPESGATSRIKTLNDELVGLTFGTDTDTPDWGTFWNRIKTAAKWNPAGTAAVSDVLTTKTFYAGSRTLQTGTFDAANLSTATVKTGTAFGVGLTGAYPSVTNPLSGDTGAADATATDVKSGLEAWDKTGALVTGTYPAPSTCSTQQYHDSYGAPVTQTTNCVNTIVWTVPSPVVTGDDKKDPRTGLIWSQLTLNSAGTVTFSAASNSSWSWDGTTDVDSIAVGSKTASQLCSERNGGGVWRLPSQKELMQAYIDGSFFNLTQPSNFFWSSTEASAAYAWYVSLYSGYAYNNTKSTSSYQVRCVR
jgi:hypothetical protein